MARRKPRTQSTAEVGLALFIHAIANTRPETEEHTTACNDRLTRARDFIVHAPAQEIAGPLQISETAFEEARVEALGALRSHCATCGLCAHFGLKPP